jgi:uncharacterized protein YbjT (DUF2867 family)
MSERDVVTGAFSYTGRYLARRLLAAGRNVRTLTGHPARPHPFGNQVEIAPYNFENPDALRKSLEGATNLYNTYWIRFPRANHTFEEAVANTRVLLRAARQAGIRKFVQLSVSNPSQDSPLPYYRGKALVEQGIMESELAYAIIRPTLVFGVGDILINNMAWLMRRFPVFAVPGSGEYRVQPVSAEDVAEIAVRAADEKGNAVRDAAGPDAYTFDELVRLIAQALGRRIRILHVTPSLDLLLIRLIGWAVRDVVLTRAEMDGLMASLLVSSQPPLGPVRFTDWLAQHTGALGCEYASELDRHFR